ncbi:MAG: hypothetical protein IPK82_06420 [Polyangiaceae bacterium]|nr:hypothetical protein [Polyangiaceae bacterium]
MRGTTTGLPLLLGLLLTACQPLKDLQSDVCGNGVVEAGEDCDLIANGESKCIEAGQPSACSFACDDEGRCPVGLGCGADNVCRRPSGTFFINAYLQTPSQAFELMAGDFDADRREEIVAVEPGRVRVLFARSPGDVQQSIIGGARRPTVVKLGKVAPSDAAGDQITDLDLTDDLVLPLQLGIGAYLSAGDRSFSAKTYQSFKFGSFPLPDINLTAEITEAVPFAIDALPGPNNSGDETAAFVSLRVEGQEQDLPNGLFVDFSSGGGGALFDIPNVLPANLSGPPVIANFVEDGPIGNCREIGFPVRKSKEFIIYKTCAIVDGKYDWFRTPDSTQAIVGKVKLSEATSGPVFTFDLNNDNHLDLVFTTSPVGGSFQLQVAYGNGKGRFHSAPTVPMVPDDQSGLLAFLPAGAPLALGFLNSDEFLDVVDASGILVGAKNDIPPLALQRIYVSSRTWTEAVIGDLNANGSRDIVACSGSEADVDVLTNTGTEFWNPSTIVTDGTVKSLVLGDVDGDLINDLAFAEVTSSIETLLDVSFGRTSGGPENAVVMGSFSSVSTVVSGNVHTFGQDLITDLGVVSTDDTGVLGFSFFPGSGERQMQSPYLLVEQLTPPQIGGVHLPIELAGGQLREFPSGEALYNDIVVLSYNPIEAATPATASTEEKITKFANSFHLWPLFGQGNGELDSAGGVGKPCQARPGVVFYPGFELASSVVVDHSTYGGSAFWTSPFVQPEPNEKTGLAISSLLQQTLIDADGNCYDGESLVANPGEMFFRVRAMDIGQDGLSDVLAVRRKFNSTCLNELFVSYFDPTFSASSCFNSKGELIATDIETSQFVIFRYGAFATGGEVVVSNMGPLEKVVDYGVGQMNDAGEAPLWVIDKDLGLVTFVLLATGELVEGGQCDGFGAVCSRPSIDASGARAFTFADVDGDGIKDAVVQGSAIEVYLGQRLVGGEIAP